MFLKKHKKPVTYQDLGGKFTTVSVISVDQKNDAKKSGPFENDNMSQSRVRVRTRSILVQNCSFWCPINFIKID